jgi:hypothetical protein
LREILFWILKPLLWLLLKLVAVEDPWERINYQVPVGKYGAGAKHDFGWYFEGESSVPVKSIDDVQAWLLECAYVHDEALFRERDHWQHPVTFESLRKGDCEDHAIWAWRKLVELGVDADLVCGRILRVDPAPEANPSGHAWIVFRADGATYLFETVAKERLEMVRALEEVRAIYRPEYGVDRHRKRFAFGGNLISLQEKHFGA